MAGASWPPHATTRARHHRQAGTGLPHRGLAATAWPRKLPAVLGGWTVRRPYSLHGVQPASPAPTFPARLRDGRCRARRVPRPRRLGLVRLATVELVFIRHGQPEWDRDGRAVQDPLLTEIGLEPRPVTSATRSSVATSTASSSPLSCGPSRPRPRWPRRSASSPRRCDWLAEIASPAVGRHPVGDGRSRSSPRRGPSPSTSSGTAFPAASRSGTSTAGSPAG